MTGSSTPWLPPPGVLDRYRRDYPSGGPKGYIISWQPRGSQALLDAVIEILNNYRRYWPLGPRQIGYILIGQFGYLKSDGHFDRVERVLGLGRRSGKIPWPAIADGWTPDPFAPLEYESPAAFRDSLSALAKDYSAVLLAGQKVIIEVWVETAGLAPQVARIAHRYGIKVYPSSGDLALPAKHDLAMRAVDRWFTDDQHIRTIVLHIGDYDHKGEGVFRAMEADVTAFVAGHIEDGSRYTAEEAAEIVVPMIRLAITPAVVDRFGLPTDPVKLPKDKKTGLPKTPPGPPLPYNCQAEALNPTQLEELLSEAIEGHLDLDVLAQARERSEREQRWAIAMTEGIEVPEDGDEEGD